MEDNIEGFGKGWVIIQQDFNNLETELQETCAQVAKLQKKQLGQNNKIALARFRINDLEQIIKEIQARHQADKGRIDNDIYSTVDACPNACEMWKAIERLKQGESINAQDLETNMYWEFGKFISQDG
nr:hypothetical protein [Tanacetum cinerariifolium]